MITQLSMDNFGPITTLNWENLGQINLVMGGNGTGKSTILRAMYSAMRTVEQERSSQTTTSPTDLLAKRVSGAFQSLQHDFDHLLSTDASGHLSCQLHTKEGLMIGYKIDPDMTGSLREVEGHFGEIKAQTSTQSTLPLPGINGAQEAHSAFLSPREVLSICNVISRNRHTEDRLDFDDADYDLATVLVTNPPRDGNDGIFSGACADLRKITGGRVRYDDKRRAWYFEKNGQRYSMGATADGYKKIGTLDALLASRYLTPGSTVYIDEPEASLHPTATAQFLDIIADLAQSGDGHGIQFFLASHSYFVIKKLYLIAQKRQMSIPILQEKDGQWEADDLQDGMPSNEIVDESVRLYLEEVGLSL
jgi:energy-coupling factor transporter ATP-binding protein EcfA2